MILLFNIGFIEIKPIDFFDVLLVSFLFYQLYKLIKASGAIRILVGVIGIYLFYLSVDALGMEMLTNILQQFIGVGVLAAIILFQSEIRKFLQEIGKAADVNKNLLGNIIKFSRGQSEPELKLTPVIEAVKVMAGSHTGALIVFGRKGETEYYEQMGDVINADLNKRLIVTIFAKNSPLHDGAVIIRDGRITAARAILPVSESTTLPAQYGLRHRAALGLSENGNSIVVVVSEETGQISLAKNGKIETNLSTTELRSKLFEYLFVKKVLSVDAEVPELKPNEVLATTTKPNE